MAETIRAPGLDLSEKIVVLGGGIIAAMALTAINSVLPTIDRALAHTPTESMFVKQLFGFTSLAMVAGAPLGALLSERMGMRRMLLAASLVFTIAGTAGLYLSSLPMLLISRLFVGASAASIQVMSLTLVNTRCEGNDRARWMGLHVAVATFCTLFIHPLSGALGEIGWRWPFIEHIVGLVLFFALLSGGKSAAAAAPASTGTTGRDGRSVFSWFPWHYLPLSLFLGAITFMPTAYGPYLLREKAGLTPGGIAAVLTGSALLGATMAFLYGRVRRSLSVHSVFAISSGLAGTGALIASLASNFPILLIGLIMHGVGVAWFVPNIMTSLGTKVTNAQQARAAGLVKMAHFLSAPLCIYLQETFLGKLGPAMAMRTVSIVAFSVFAAALWRMWTPGKQQVVPAE